MNEFQKIKKMKKLLCFFGWHKFTYKLSDCIKEFGHIPLENRMPKTAKCKRCGTPYHNPKKIIK